MIRFLNVLSFILVITLSVVLYNVKYRIDAQEDVQAKLQQDILNEEDAIRVLRAEHSYLTQPDRLQALADRHLQLAPLHASQIATFDDLPMPPRDEDFFGPAGRQALGGYAGIAPSTGVQ